MLEVNFISISKRCKFNLFQLWLEHGGILNSWPG